jgi:palmitoyltransferase ZDHHC6
MTAFNSIYHFYCLLGNSTTIEGWEKDKATIMVRRGKIQEVRKRIMVLFTG